MMPADDSVALALGWIWAVILGRERFNEHNFAILKTPALAKAGEGGVAGGDRVLGLV